MIVAQNTKQCRGCEVKEEEEVNSEKGSTPFDLIPWLAGRERDVSEPLRRPNPNALIEVVF